jgi:hypothetical protein
MFEVGRTYTIVTQNHEGESSISAEVLEYEYPMLKLDRVGNYEILNVTSPAFVRAKPNDKKAREDEDKAHKEFIDSISITKPADD